MPQEQEQKRTQRRADGTAPAGAETDTAKTTSKGQELKEEMDLYLNGEWTPVEPLSFTDRETFEGVGAGKIPCPFCPGTGAASY